MNISDCKLEHINCPQCNADNYEVVYPARLNQEISFDYLDETPAHFAIVRCYKCGLVYSNPVFSKQTFLELYRESSLENIEMLESSRALELNMRRYLDHLLSCAAAGGGKILDVGCGSGHLLEYAANLGLDTYGVEPSQSAAEYCSARLNGAKVINSDYHSGLFSEGSFDLITIVHVIDHVTDPVGLLRTAAEQLKPGGCLLVATHNIGSLLARVMRENFIAFSIQHITYYTPNILGKMLGNCGFEVVRKFNSVTSYPLSHYVENGIAHTGLKSTLLSLLNILKLDSFMFTFPFGNFELVARKSA